MTIDAHQHFWKYHPKGFGWITDEMSAIRKDFLPDDLAPLLRENEIDGCVSVQVDPSESENEFLLGLAGQHAFIKGVVGWVDFRSEDISEKLGYYAQFPKLKGFRHIVQGEADGFLLTPAFLRGIKALRNTKFTYDILVYARQLPDVIRFLDQNSGQKFVIDHIAKPSIRIAEISDWEKSMAEVARHENVYCKLSGMVTEARWSEWRHDDFRPYLDTVFECFGPGRLLYGSDWPVCLVAASYHQQRSIVEGYISNLTAGEKELIRGGNAVRFYNL